MTVNDDLADSETEAIINDPSGGFLGHLAPSEAIPHYAYFGPKQFLQIFEREHNPNRQTDHWFLLTGVTQRVFNETFLEAESGPFSRAFAYDPFFHRLLVATPESTTHSVAGTAFDRMVDRAAEDIGMDYEVVAMGKGYHAAEMGTKQPAMAWQPEEIGPGRDNRWPSVVLEVVVSESDPRPKLQADLRYWFRAPPLDTVRTVFILIINSRMDEIVIEKWERTAADERPHIVQRVVLSRMETGGNVMITGSPLIIGFEHLFLRPPRTPEERDLQLNGEKLQFIAERIWRYQRLNSK
ncbi:hypothetical protein ASPCAL13725 [Aspergillus calidoustus]|uniref:Restriction endonuclease domain-containing protein n=1 Tax=Aspergillus calidoustus TaxID=454130 RepID=A0A0U5GFP4_ASPCI|nr:hypothetical protein ASPCAL13725 [Aspergillus calidoustus]